VLLVLYLNRGSVDVWIPFFRASNVSIAGELLTAMTRTPIARRWPAAEVFPWRERGRRKKAM